MFAINVGRIPFDCIVKIDWDGDEYYNVPHIYCNFNEKMGTPYKEIVYYGKANGSEYLYEIEEPILNK